MALYRHVRNKDEIVDAPAVQASSTATATATGPTRRSSGNS
jgi:hypothetical protein